jgi:hypothetical protein
MDMISTRDRLMLAFAELDAYGIVATHAAHGSPELTRIAMRSLLLSRYPNGTGAFMFWAAADEDNFDADGMLRADLPLYPSGAAEDEAGAPRSRIKDSRSYAGPTTSWRCGESVNPWPIRRDTGFPVRDVICRTVRRPL